MAAKKRISMKQERNLPSKKNNDGLENFPIVGIGSSAGGFEAFQKLFLNLPEKGGAAFIVVTHRAPEHHDLLLELVRNNTKLKAETVTNNMEIKPNYIYIAPPQNSITVKDGFLFLKSFIEHNVNKMPIDYFFRSLAEDRKERAICIILSGTGTDGTLGLKSVREAEGVSIVQDPDDAKYNGMPRSAISSGLVDFVLPVEKIPEQLASLFKRMPIRRLEKETEGDKSNESLTKILQLLRVHTGNDFSYYKKSTIHRRIERRMTLHEIDSFPLYLRYLQEHPEELRLLFKELLISVTSFFRDPDAFESLKKNVLPKLLADKPENYLIRMWVPACATGEEVYSIAMILYEYMEEVNKTFKIQIFGTDINEDSINRARMGVYIDNIAMDVSPERLKKFFIKEGNTYLIKKEIRESAIFALQNIIKDAPFTKLDILSCRNLMIYFSSELQDKLIPIFHYSLNPGGILFIGSSESVGNFSDGFKLVDHKWKIFQRTSSVSLPPMFQSNLPFKVNEPVPKGTRVETKKAKEISMTELIQKTLLNSFTPASVLINEKGDIVYIHGKTGKYLEPAMGQAELNIITMAREGLQYELRSVMREAVLQKKEVSRSGISVKTNGSYQQIKLTIKPIEENEAGANFLLVVFEEMENPVKEEDAKNKKGTHASKRVAELETELKYTKESLQATVEELQASNEELQSANEELQSTNEELQSTNEEMETSKEELQSVNEELITLNSELQNKIEMLSHAESDMKNLLNSTNIGTIFLDREMKVKRFTSEATKLINLINTDIGRPLEHIVTKLKYTELMMDIQKVNETLIFIEKEVETVDGNRFLMRILPYRTNENLIDGVVLTFIDITTLTNVSKHVIDLNKALKTAVDFAEGIIHVISDPLVILSDKCIVTSANKAFYSEFNLTKNQTLEKSIFDLADSKWNIPELHNLLGKLLLENEEYNNYPLCIEISGKGKKLFKVNAKQVFSKKIDSQIFVLAFEEDSKGCN